jgi:hypothetical protein
MKRSAGSGAADAGRAPGTMCGFTAGAAASTGGADAGSRGSGTRFAATGLRSTSVAPPTAVTAPGTP